MELDEIKSLLTDTKTLIAKIEAEKPIGTDTIETYQKQWDTKSHEVKDPVKRKDKQLETDNGPTTQAVTRLPIPMQQQIVKLAAAFLCGNPIQLDADPADKTETDLFEVMKKNWLLTKLHYESKRLAKLMMAETEVAELWYAEPAPEGYWKGTPNDTSAVKLRLRLKVLANKFGDGLYPVFNNSGDMVAFGRKYQLRKDSKQEDHFDLYTDDFTYKYTMVANEWVLDKKANLFKKIPVIYYSQENVEWYDVQEMIERLETLISNHSDANDYSAFPIMFVNGELEGFASKGEQGKIIVGKNGATAEWLTNTQSVESLKLEYTNLRSLIHDMTSTPDISMEQMNALGTYSGIALKMLFMAAHLKAADKEETFGKGIQRRINFLKYALGNYVNTKLSDAVGMDIEPKFEYYLPKDYNEIITLLNTATGGAPVMSQETALANNPLVKDAKEELKKIKAEGLDNQQNANAPL